jgi:hypothetical protein
MCGICAGVKGKVNIGDIVFADPVWDYQSGKFIKEDGVAKFSISPHQLDRLKCYVHLLMFYRRTKSYF